MDQVVTASLTDWAAEQPGAAALTVVDRDGAQNGALTYAALDERSSRLAHALRQRGAHSGDHLAVTMPNRVEFLETTWAAQRSGLIYTTVSTSLGPDEARYIVEDCGARTVVSVDDEVRVSCPDGETVAYEALLREGGATADPTWHEGGDLLYSSGTTGRPKGVFRPVAGRPTGTPDSATRLAIEQFGLTNDAVFLSPGPLYHAAPLRYSMAQHRLGNHAVVMTGFDAETFLRTVEQYGVTHTLLVPTMFVRLLRLDPAVRNRYDLTSLRSVWHGAAPCPCDVKQAMIDWLGPKLIENYGGSEGNGVTVADSRTWLARPGTVGRAARGIVHIVDDAGRELPTGEIGTVYFEGGLPFEYHRDPVQTASAYNDRGWSTIGDLGSLDAEGHLYLSDRRTHLIISGGVNVYPREAEDALTLHPAVEDVVVIGVPDDEYGEQVKAVVVLRPGHEPTDATADLLVAHCRSRLARVKCPRSVDFVAALPREPTGKIATRLVKAAYWT